MVEPLKNNFISMLPVTLPTRGAKLLEGKKLLSLLEEKKLRVGQWDLFFRISITVGALRSYFWVLQE